MNSKCINNTIASEYTSKAKFTDDNIPAELCNTRRHVFGKPCVDFNQKMNDVLSNTHLKHKLNDERVHNEQTRLDEINVIEEQKRRERREKRERERQMQEGNTRYGLGSSLNKNNTTSYQYNKQNSNDNNTSISNITNYQNINKNSNLDLNGIMDKIRSISAAQNIDSEALMADFFKDRKNTTYEELKSLLQRKFDLSENECNRFLGQIVSVPPIIGGNLSSYNNNNVSSSYINTNDNNIQLEDFITLFKRSLDFPSQKSYLNKDKKGVLDENQFERERRLLNSYASKMGN